MRILTFDPSGNWGEKEGYGHTGWAVFDDGQLIDFGDIAAKDFSRQEAYWREHEFLIVNKAPDLVICENYRLYAGARGKAQINSTMDTPQLIGYIRMVCWTKEIALDLQAPSDKTPVNDERLVRAGIFEKKGNKHYCSGRPTNLHMRDAIRHGVYYYKFKRGKG